MHSLPADKCMLYYSDVTSFMLLPLQAQDAMDAAEADIPAYPLEPIRSKRLKEVESGPERVVKVSTRCTYQCIAWACPQQRMPGSVCASSKLCTPGMPCTCLWCRSAQVLVGVDSVL